jgi:hypothetical protein
MSPLTALSTQTKICRFVDAPIKAQNIKLEEELQKPYM